jgi:hypothetical protein
MFMRLCTHCVSCTVIDGHEDNKETSLKYLNSFPFGTEGPQLTSAIRKLVRWSAVLKGFYVLSLQLFNGRAVPSWHQSGCQHDDLRIVGQADARHNLR